MGVELGLADLAAGKPVLVFDADDREGETDLVLPAQFFSPLMVRRYRQDAGGLICACVSPEYAKKTGLPFLTDVMHEAEGRFPLLTRLLAHKLPYDARSSFSITVNHRENFTGITDNDRSRTVIGLSEKEYSAPEDFAAAFRAPGHVHLLIGSNGGLKERQGHTELALALLRWAGEKEKHVRPIAVICEMLGDNGKALSKDKAKFYAVRNNLQFIEGKEILVRAKEKGEM